MLKVWMNLYDNIFNVSWEYLNKFKMNVMSMEYSKQILKQCFQLFKEKLNIFKWHFGGIF
jgi:hypothetical protein